MPEFTPSQLAEADEYSRQQTLYALDAVQREGRGTDGEEERLRTEHFRERLEQIARGEA